jgi:hypothetical protein
MLLVYLLDLSMVFHRIDFGLSCTLSLGFHDVIMFCVFSSFLGQSFLPPLMCDASLFYPSLKYYNSRLFVMALPMQGSASDSHLSRISVSQLSPS